MKKILLVILLIGLLVGLSAIKTYREHQKQSSAFEQGRHANVGEVDSLSQLADSMKLAAGEREVQFGDSLTQIAKVYRSNVDSLENVIDSQSDNINALKKKVADASRSAQTSKPATKKPTALSAHERILTYYKQRYADLPKDLSEYEKRIAINEIREETARRFSISVAELEKIRQANKLNY